MLLILIAVVIFSLFVPFVLLAGRTSKEDRRMRARFAMLQTGGAGSLSSSSQISLLKSAEEEPGDFLMAATARLSSFFKLEALILQANSQRTPQALLRVSLLAAFTSMLITFLGARNLLASIAVGVVAGYLPLFLLRGQAKRRTAAMNKVLPTVLDMISRALRAGHSMPAAIGIVAEEAAEPARTAFAEVFQKQKFGLPMRDALLELVGCFPSDDLKVLVTAILVQRDTGGNLVQILERTSTVIRERLKLQGDVRVHTAQGRLTGWILCSLPVLMLAMLTLTNPSYPGILIDDPLGRKLLYSGVFLLCLGGFLIHRIVKAIEV